MEAPLIAPVGASSRNWWPDSMAVTWKYLAGTRPSFLPTAIFSPSLLNLVEGEYFGVSPLMLQLVVSGSELSNLIGTILPLHGYTRTEGGGGLSG